MLKNFLNQSGVNALNKENQKSVMGGSFNCYCNGWYTGTGSSSTDCANKCADCSSCWGKRGNGLEPAPQ